MRYFFYLAGEEPHDLLGHNCANDKEAKDHANFIANRMGTEKPGLVREGNFIVVKANWARRSLARRWLSRWYDAAWSCSEVRMHSGGGERTRNAAEERIGTLSVVIAKSGMHLE
jgi:hypothetical protein